MTDHSVHRDGISKTRFRFQLGSSYPNFCCGCGFSFLFLESSYKLPLHFHFNVIVFFYFRYSISCLITKPRIAGPHSMLDKRADSLSIRFLAAVVRAPLGSYVTWESQVLLTDGQVVSLTGSSGFRPPLMNPIGSKKWNILQWAVKPLPRPPPPTPPRPAPAAPPPQKKENSRIKASIRAFITWFNHWDEQAAEPSGWCPQFIGKWTEQRHVLREKI